MTMMFHGSADDHDDQKLPSDIKFFNDLDWSQALASLEANPLGVGKFFNGWLARHENELQGLTFAEFSEMEQQFNTALGPPVDGVPDDERTDMDSEWADSLRDHMFVRWARVNGIKGNGLYKEPRPTILEGLDRHPPRADPTLQSKDDLQASVDAVSGRVEEGSAVQPEVIGAAPVDQAALDNGLHRVERLSAELKRHVDSARTRLGSPQPGEADRVTTTRDDLNAKLAHLGSLDKRNWSTWHQGENPLINDIVSAAREAHKASQKPSSIIANVTDKIRHELAKEEVGAHQQAAHRHGEQPVVFAGITRADYVKAVALGAIKGTSQQVHGLAERVHDLGKTVRQEVNHKLPSPLRFQRANQQQTEPKFTLDS